MSLFHNIIALVTLSCSLITPSVLLHGTDFGSSEVPEEAYYITNAVGITQSGQEGSGVAQRWNYLTKELLSGWLTLHGPLNVVLGPVFDHDDDGRLDPLTDTRYDSLTHNTNCEDGDHYVKK